MLGRGVGLADLVERCHFPSFPAGEEVCRLVRAGLFDYAHRLQWLSNSECAHLNRHDAWLEFLGVVLLADEIDSFLAALEGDRRAAGLARACRDEVDLLLVLAELCEDHAMPRAAEEARYFHALADNEWRGFGWAARTVVPEDDDDDVDDVGDDTDEGGGDDDEWE
jgi:hypothetical protein